MIREDNRKWTVQQQLFFEAVAGTKNILSEAVAGAGKSTTAVESLRQVKPGEKPGFVAFNKHIADELKHKLGDRAKAMTLHSLGNAAVRKNFPDATQDANKLSNLADRLFPETKKQERNLICDEVRRKKQQGVTPEWIGLEAVWRLPDASFQALEYDAECRVFDLLSGSIEDETTFDFDDMLYWPFVKELSVEQFGFLIVDEAQDLNPLQQYLARSATKSGRLAIVGDRYQSIYLFTGADPDSIPNFAEYLSGTPQGLESAPLTVTFRCPLTHVALARQLVPHISAPENAKEGLVTHDSRLPDFQPGDLVICRNNAPLVSLTYRLIQEGKKARMKGRDIGKGMLALIDRIRPHDISDLMSRSWEIRQQETKRLIDRKATQQQLEAVVDKFECLDAIATDSRSLNDLRAFIEKVFDDSEYVDSSKFITLSSVHRAKGLESSNVTLLGYDELPMSWKHQTPAERQQELNVLYVALTRSKDVLNLIIK